MIPQIPPPVRRGARVGVAALSGPVDPDRLAAGLQALAELGFEPRPARNLTSRHDLFAGSDAARLEALHELADADDVEAIFFARGGHGVTRLLPELDWERLARRPRAWVGYSDLTPLLNGLTERTGLVTFHGPMVAADLARGLLPAERASLLGALAAQWPQVHALSGEAERPRAGGDRPAEGRIAGGCLSLLVTLLGTPWSVDLNGKLLVLEDTGEPSYRLDRMLTHLSLSGSLTGVQGAVVGDLRGTDEPSDSPSRTPERLRRVLPDVPVLLGLEIGHRAPNRTLPIGLPGRLDPASRTLVVGPGELAP